MTDIIKKETEKGNYTGVILLDLQKAFDTVNHQILCQKLTAIGLNPSAVKWFESYLNDRMQSVAINGTVSDLKYVSCGVPQGSILGPTLFQIYVNDMSMAVDCSLLLYADDSILLTSGKSVEQIETVLSKNMDSVSNWLIDNRLSLHLGKTESILFGPIRKLKETSLTIMCKGNQIEQKDHVNYLGLRLDNTLSGDNIAKDVIAKCNNRLKFLYRNGHSLNIHTKKLLCSALIQCHYDYACSSWYSSVSQTYKKKLQTHQNKMVRFILDKNSRSHIGCHEFGRLKWLNVEKRVIQLKLNNMHKITYDKAPAYLKEDFTKLMRNNSYVGRHNQMTYTVPLMRKGAGRSTFTYTGINEWNGLPLHLKQIKNFSIFKNTVKQHLMNKMSSEENDSFIYY